MRNPDNLPTRALRKQQNQRAGTNPRPTRGRRHSERDRDRHLVLLELAVGIGLVLPGGVLRVRVPPALAAIIVIAIALRAGKPQQLVVQVMHPWEARTTAEAVKATPPRLRNRANETDLGAARRKLRGSLRSRRECRRLGDERRRGGSTRPSGRNWGEGALRETTGGEAQHRSPW